VSAAIRALLIGEPDDLDARVAGALLQQIADRPVTVTITGVAPRLPLISFWAPLTGQVTVGQIKALSLALASAAARTAGGLLPGDIPVQHRAVRCWAEAMRRASEYDVIVIAGRPWRRRDRRRLVALVASLSRLTGAPASPTPLARPGV
jgi:hypothetical protein